MFIFKPNGIAIGITMVLFETLINDKVFIFYFCGHYMNYCPIRQIYCPRKLGQYIGVQGNNSYNALEVKNNYLLSLISVQIRVK